MSKLASDAIDVPPPAPPNKLAMDVPLPIALPMPSPRMPPNKASRSPAFLPCSLRIAKELNAPLTALLPRAVAAKEAICGKKNSG